MPTINDKELTKEDVRRLTHEEYKNLETRLRRKAKNNNLRIVKHNHPLHGSWYYVSNNKNHIVSDASCSLGMGMDELIIWLYNFTEKIDSA